MNKFKKILQPKKYIKELVVQQANLQLRKNNYLPIHETKTEDIFIAGFPKSGNTWMQSLVSGLVFGINPAYLPSTLAHELVPDVHYKTYYKRFLDRAFFKTHFLPMPHYRKVIFLVRDGRDAMVSYYSMHKAMGKNVTLQSMIIDGNAVFPTKWHLHTREWMKNPYSADLLVVKYEDLVNDSFNELCNICSFIGIERTEETIRKVIEGCSFNEMKRKAIDFGLENDQWGLDKKFFRKGKVGSYLDEMPPDLIEFFNSEAQEELKRFSY